MIDPVVEVTQDTVKEMSSDDLIFNHNRLHADYFTVVDQGESIDDLNLVLSLINDHHLIVQEMISREITHNFLDYMDSEFFVEKIEKQQSAYNDYPNGSRNSVIQLHVRGKSLHVDYRIDVGKYLIGWTLSAQVAGKVSEVTSVSEARKLISGYSPQKGNQYLKPIYGTNRVVAVPKDTHDKKWLTVNRVIPPGEPGASAEYDGVFAIVDKPTTEIGYQSNNYHEYFLTGSRIGFNGIIYFRKTQRGWIASMKTHFLPTILSTGSRREGRMPPGGKSAIPKSLMSQTPTEFRYWKESGSKAKDVRDALVKERIFTEKNIKIVNGKFRRVVIKYYLDIEAKKNFISEDRIREHTTAEKIKDIDGYKPKNMNNSQLRDDFRIALAWYSTSIRNPRGIKFTREQILDVLIKIIKELIVRGSDVIQFSPSKMKDLARRGFEAAIRRGKIKIPDEMLEKLEKNFLDEPNKDLNIFEIAKRNEERIIGGVVLEPNKTDLHFHKYGDEAVRGAAYSFMEGYFPGGKHGIRIMHRGQSIADKVRVLESYLAPIDYDVDVVHLGQKIKRLTITKGSWIMYLRILDDQLWSDIKSKKFKAFSIGGFARVKPV